MNTRLIDFHVENQFFVSVRQHENKKGVSAIYPPNVIGMNTEMFSNDYKIEDNKILFESENSHGKIDDKIITLPKYSIRPIIAADITLKALKQRIPIPLIKTYLANGDPHDKNITVILEIDCSEEDLVREKKLISTFKSLMSGEPVSEEDIEASEIQSGFEMLGNLFNTGGI